MYVDNILITCSSSTLVHKLIDSLNWTVDLKKLGIHEQFLTLK